MAMFNSKLLVYQREWLGNHRENPSWFPVISQLDCWVLNSHFSNFFDGEIPVIMGKNGKNHYSWKSRKIPIILLMGRNIWRMENYIAKSGEVLLESFHEKLNLYLTGTLDRSCPVCHVQAGNSWGPWGNHQLRPTGTGHDGHGCDMMPWWPW